MKDGEASTTARRVAAQRLSFARVVTAYGRPDADRQLQADVAGDLEGVETPMTRFLRSRTNFFDRVVVDSIDTGTDQVVLLGAGYDGRSLRYAKPGVRWFELDHRDTQADERSRLHRLDIVSAAISFAAVDFGVDDVAATLRRAGYDPAHPALFACEGVAGYLAGEVLSSLLDSLHTCAASGSPGHGHPTPARVELGAVQTVPVAIRRRPGGRAVGLRRPAKRSHRVPADLRLEGGTGDRSGRA